MEIARLLGAGVQDELGLAVDLTHPDVELHVDAYARDVFVSVDRLRGAGGLPVGTSGRALVLLSGGIDSPVAAYRMMRRGLHCDFVHFSGQPLTGPESAYKAYALVGRLTRFQGRSRLFVVPFGLAQRQLAISGAGRLQVLAQRLLMVRVADALARREQCEALVTGDSLGQVASQTLRNLEVVEGAATLPLLRPLLDRDKSEIIEAAQRLGTFETSILPDEDCCTLLAPRRAVTWTDPEPLIELESACRRGDRGRAARRAGPGHVATAGTRRQACAGVRFRLTRREAQAASEAGRAARPCSSSRRGPASTNRRGSRVPAAASASMAIPSEKASSPRRARRRRSPRAQRAEAARGQWCACARRRGRPPTTR